MFFRPLSTGLLSFLAGSLLSASAALAVPMDFSFTFTNNPIDGGGLITGVIRGLEEGTGAATSVEVLSNTKNFGIGEYVGGIAFNSWTVTGGTITSVNFIALSPSDADSRLWIASDPTEGFFGGLNSRDRVPTLSDTITFEKLPADDVAPIPLPAGAPLLLTGIAALVVLRRRNRNT
ncbi:MAG: VPLPA-CTERM sorting domain-containing protein [Pseudomonadota bacterium]